MNILLLGSGGREHAFAWKLTQSPLCTQLFIAPGNAGTSNHGKNVPITTTDFEALKVFCIDEAIQMIVVGPEDPLVDGIYDYFKTSHLNHIIVIGPSAGGAQLEGSKSFSKHFMQRHNIPTAAYAEFTESNFQEGLEYLRHHTLPIVLKADGLAAGKGVVIAQTIDEAKEVFTSMIKHRQFGEASAKVVIEQFLQGIEVSVFVLTDGVSYKIVGHAKDYKRIGEGDTGPNTGGMGCVSPVPFVDEEFMNKVEQNIIVPTIKGLQKENLEYKGFVFFGLIKVGDEPYVIEYNCRMGDPETEVVLPRLQNDLVELFVALHQGKLESVQVNLDDRSVATIVAVSGGYPGKYNKGFSIHGLDKITGDVLLFHAGTTAKDGAVVTNGGRVLAMTAFARTIQQAAQNSINTLQKLNPGYQSAKIKL